MKGIDEIISRRGRGRGIALSACPNRFPFSEQIDFQKPQSQRPRCWLDTVFPLGALRFRGHWFVWPCRCELASIMWVSRTSVASIYLTACSSRPRFLARAHFPLSMGVTNNKTALAQCLFLKLPQKTSHFVRHTFFSSSFFSSND